MTNIKQHLYKAASVVAIVGVVASPAFVSAATDTTTVRATINSTLTMSNSTALVGLTVNTGGSALEAIGSDVVTVNTNNSAGYTLDVAASDATTSLTDGGNTISATTGETSLGGTATALDTNSWGWCIAGETACDGSYTTGDDQAVGASFIAMPASGSEITVKTTATTATNDTTTFYYGVNVDSSQADGTYDDVVTYTATAN